MAVTLRDIAHQTPSVIPSSDIESLSGDTDAIHYGSHSES